MIIDVLTTTRAEYGLMRPLIRSLMADDYFKARLIVTGTHLSEEYGMTYKEIENDGFEAYKKIPILGTSQGASFVSETMANAMVQFTTHFKADRPDFLLVDGDRYETLAICIAAVNCNVPIIHMSGGATTEGAADECYRHAITKMSLLHFPVTEIYRKRVIQLGESPDRVFNVGSLGIENIKTIKYLSKDELERSINFSLDKPYALVTFHPVTLEQGTAVDELNELLAACDMADDLKFIFTMANADNEGEAINNRLLEYANTNKGKVICVPSLGSVRYLSAVKYSAFVLGNSSSGIVEVPSFGIPTINIGDRQSGRLQAESIINCEPVRGEIAEAIRKARSKDFIEKSKKAINPNGDGDTSRKIIAAIKEYVACNGVDLKKKFFNINYKLGDM